MYIRSTLQEKTQFLEERQFWLGRLSMVVYYVILCKFILYSKKIILRKQQVQTSVNYAMESVMQPCSCLHQELSQGVKFSAARKDRLEYVESYWKVSKIYSSSLFGNQNIFRRPTMLSEIFKDFELPSKKFLPTPLIGGTDRNPPNCTISQLMNYL